MTPSASECPESREGRAAPTEPAATPFSVALEQWLRCHEPITLGSLAATFQEKSFAVSILLLMFLPALPLPTGGISHVFEVMAALLALQIIAGRTTIWLPQRWRERELGGISTKKSIPLMIRWIRRLERFSRPRWTRLLQLRPVQRLIGVALLGTCATALLSPPFSGLDTIPGLAAVAICGGVLLGDALLVLIGVGVEVAGVIVIVTLGASAVQWVRHLF